MSEWEIRDAGPQDFEEIAAIYNHYIKDTVVTFEEDEVTGEEMGRRITAVTDSGFPWLSVVQDGRVVGSAYASQWNKRSAYRFSAEVSVYLDHRATGGGLGSYLYDALFEILKGKSVHTAIGGIALPNPASVALHEKFGMEKVAHYKDVGFKFGKWIDVGYWQVIL